MAKKYWISSSSTSFNTAGNWSGGVAPANSDTLYFGAYGSANCATNIASTGLTGLTIIVEPGYTGQIGSVTAGVPAYLQISGGTLRMASTPGGSIYPGSPRVLIDFGTANPGTVLMEFGNSVGADPSIPAVCVIGSGSGALTINQSGGSLGVAVYPGEVATITNITTIDGGTTLLGQGVTLTAATFAAGTITDRRDNTATAIRVAGAAYNYSGTGATTTLNVDAGTCTYSGTGTITTANLRGLLDMSQDSQAKTVTTVNRYDGGSLNLNNGVPAGITITNAINNYGSAGSCGWLTVAAGGTLKPA